MFPLEDTGPKEERGLLALGSCLGRPSPLGGREQRRLGDLGAHGFLGSLPGAERGPEGG